jgi:hypothetical protein
LAKDELLRSGVDSTPQAATTRDKAPLIGTKICAEHYLEQTGEALLAIGRYKALRTYLQQLPVSPRKV